MLCAHHMPLHTQESRQKKKSTLCAIWWKNLEGGGCFFFREGGSISKGGHVSAFERGALAGGGPLAWGGGGLLNLS